MNIFFQVDHTAFIELSSNILITNVGIFKVKLTLGLSLMRALILKTGKSSIGETDFYVVRN